MADFAWEIFGKIVALAYNIANSFSGESFDTFKQFQNNFSLQNIP